MAEEAREGDISLPSPIFSENCIIISWFWETATIKKGFRKQSRKCHLPRPLFRVHLPNVHFGLNSMEEEKTRSTLLGQATFFFRYLLKIATPFDKQIDPLKNVNNSRGCNGSCISYYFRSKISFYLARVFLTLKKGWWMGGTYQWSHFQESINHSKK